MWLRPKAWAPHFLYGRALKPAWDLCAALLGVPCATWPGRVHQVDPGSLDVAY